MAGFKLTRLSGVTLLLNPWNVPPNDQAHVRVNESDMSDSINILT